MKVLYVKNGSERDRKFQLQTMIYENNGKRFVRKSVLYDEAMPHLHSMYENYIKLSKSIINPKVKLAKILDKNERSLTFEYIDGISLAKKFNQIIKTEDNINLFIQEYISFLKNSFKTTLFDSKNITDEFREIFGDFDYSVLDGEICFDGVSNIDLIFSNIIYKDDEFYIIDYEWVFESNIPVNYTLYRALLNKSLLANNVQSNLLYKNIESHFIGKYVCRTSFYQYGKKYGKNRMIVERQIQEKDQLLQEKDQQIQKKELQIQEKEQLVKEKERQIQEKNYQIQEKELEIQKQISDNIELIQIAESMRIKNRIKKLFQFRKKVDKL